MSAFVKQADVEQEQFDWGTIGWRCRPANTGSKSLVVMDVTLEPGGLLRTLAGTERLRVNSLHSQGVDRLGADLAVEARAPDGVVEAFRVAHAQRFAVAVQWHPEWKVMDNPFSRVLFAAFGAASRERAKAR